MESAFDPFLLRDPAEALFVSLVASVAGIVLLLVFILCRRAIRKRCSSRHDRRSQYIRKHGNEILGGQIRAEQRFFDRMDHPLVESIVLDRMDLAGRRGAW